MPHAPRYGLLDAWRGVACLMVIGHHAGFALNWSDAEVTGWEGWARYAIVALSRWLDRGVPMFFVISGYCIAASADALREKQASAWRFLSRRARRIYPPYWVALLGFVGIVAGLDAAGLPWLHHGAYALELESPGKLGWPQWFGNVTLTETWRPWYGGHDVRVYTRIAWTLCYEEQFYFVCFLILSVAPRYFFGLLAILTLGIGGFDLFAIDCGWIHAFDGTFLFRWGEFAAGLAVYWRLTSAKTAQNRRVIDLILVAGAVYLGLVRWFQPPSRDAVAPALDALGVACGFALILISTRRWDDRAMASPAILPLRACGRRCYSLYLAHLPVCVVGNLGLCGLGLTGFWARVGVVIPVSFAASIVAGWIFFAAVERWFLNPDAVARGRNLVAIPSAGETPAGS